MVEIFKKKLKSGLKVAAVPAPEMRSVTTFVFVANGSRYERSNESGISHFLEHMLFKGSKKRPTEEEVFYGLDRTGGEYNGLTHKEWTGYYVRVRPEHFAFSTEWLSDVLLNPLFREKEIEKERGVILEEMNMYLDTPARYIWDTWEKQLFGEHPLGRLIIGKRENVERFDKKSFKSYFEKHYCLPNLMVAAAGCMGKEQIFEEVEKAFANVEKGEIFTPERFIERQKGPDFRFLEKETDQNHISLGFRGYDLHHEKRYAQAVLANLLGGMRSSRMFMAVRGRRGLAYYIQTGSQAYTDAGYLTTTAGVNKDKTEKAVRTILEEYKKIKQAGPLPGEVERAKENLKGEMVLDLESSSSLAHFTGKAELLNMKERTPEEVTERIEAVSAEDVKEAARDILKKGKLNMAMIGRGSEKAIKKIINNF